MEDQEKREAALPPELLILLDAFRAEMNAKFSTLKAWGVAALVGGGTVGGVVSALVGPHATAQKTGEVATLVVHFLT